MQIPRRGKFWSTTCVQGTYTITETVAPLGYVIDDDPTRSSP